MIAINNNKQSLTSLLTGMLVDPSILEETLIAGISLDSRQINAGYLLLLLATDETKCQTYLEQALASGASVVLYDLEHDLTSNEITALAKQNIATYAIRNLAEKAGEIAARFYGHPSLALTIIAVTGTNGKTSVSHFIAQSLEALGLPCGIVGTLGVGRVNSLISTGMTTPDPITLQGVLAEFCQQGINYAVIEASSHALAQGRLNGVAIDVAILTNLTRDHLDYHNTMAEYAAAKAQLFKVAGLKTAIINSADDFGRSLINDLSTTENSAVVWSYSSKDSEAIFVADNGRINQQGVQFDFVFAGKTVTVNSPLLGEFNIDNLLATMASLCAIAIPVENVIDVIEQCHSVAGRMQVYSKQQQTRLVVDFAHTPDALTQALKSLRAGVPTSGQLWCVFGCGGERDVGKRPEMGRCAEKYADSVVLTDDNPRSEMPATIVNDILAGVAAPEKIHIEHDRKTAIAYAISHATSDDIVLVAGKGCEQYQEISGVKQPFSDANIAIEMLAANDKQNQAMRMGA